MNVLYRNDREGYSWGVFSQNNRGCFIINDKTASIYENLFIAAEFP